MLSAASANRGDAGPDGGVLGGAIGGAIGLRPTIVVCGAGSVLAALWLIGSPARATRDLPGEVG